MYDIFNIDMIWWCSQGASSYPYDNNGNKLNPTDYGLGKGAVLTWLNSVQFINQNTQQVDQALTNAFLNPYETENNVEQWIKWAQFFCSPACHKDSKWTMVQVCAHITHSFFLIFFFEGCGGGGI